MMRRNLWVLTAAVLLAFTLHGLADENAPASDGVEEIQARIRLLRDLANPGANPNTDAAPVGKFAAEARSMMGQYQSLEMMVSRGDLANARMMVRQWLNTTTVPDLKRVYEELIKQLDVKLDSVQARYNAQVDAVIKRAGDACRNAKTSADLDAASAEIEDLRQGGIPGESRFNRIRRKLDGAANFLQMWDRYVSAKEADSTPMMLQVLSEMSNRDYGYRTMVLPNSEINKLRDDLQRASMAQINSVLTDPAHVPAADAPVEAWEKVVDDVQSAYQQINNGSGYYSQAAFSSGFSRMNSLRRKVDLINSGLASWMQVLYIERAGNTRSALRQLQMFESSAALDGVFITAERVSAKRVQLAAKIAAQPDIDSPEVQDVDRAVKEFRKPEDLPTVMRRLSAYDNYSGASADEIRSLRGDLIVLTRMRAALDDGRAGDFWNAMYMNASDSPHRWAATTRAMRQTLSLRMIASSPRMNDIGEPLPGETLDRMLLRVADKAAEKGDYKRVLQLLDALRRYAYGNYGNGPSPLWLSGEIDSVQVYLSGRQLEDAGEIVEAAAAYKNVLRYTGDRVPVKEAGKRLATLRKEHPEITPATNPSR
ncbi:MAG: hypothetical protein K8S99_13330 [Planctomycetes bacterium]|nr:hypothetical protein [Planctomycetota bacterium]